MTKIDKATETIKKEPSDKTASTEHERQLAADLETISAIRENPDILRRHPELITLIDIPHETGSAVSLIERQVVALREQSQAQEDRLKELMAVARDNERLADSRHRLAINLLSAHDQDDVVSTVLDLLSNELGADNAVIKLFSDDEQLVRQSAGQFIRTDDESLKVFKTMLEHKNTVCGRATDEQKDILFGKQSDEINSVAIIPLVSGANLGLIGLGASDEKRFSPSMGTEFLSQVGELVSASLALHLEK